MSNKAFLFCINCQCVMLVHLDLGLHHLLKNYDPPELIDCFGPFASSEPPMLELCWEDHVSVPSIDELELINNNANDLYFDLTGENMVRGI